MALLQLEQIKPRPTPGKLVEITPPAVEKIKGMLADRAELEGKSLRIYVTSGGCAGYSYGMAFDEQTNEDTVVDCDGLKVLLDPESVPWLKGIRVDYEESMLGSGFAITNPNAVSSCGCGTSFSKGDGASTADEGSCH